MSATCEYARFLREQWPNDGRLDGFEEGCALDEGALQDTMLRYQEFLVDAHTAGEPAFTMKDFLAYFRQRYTLSWEKIGAEYQQKIFVTYMAWRQAMGEQRAKNTRIMATLRDALRMVIDAPVTHEIFLQLDQEVTDNVAWGALKDA